MSRIEDVLSADSLSREKNRKDASSTAEDAAEHHDPQEAGEEDPDGNMAGSPNSRTLLDSMGWNGDAEANSGDKPPAPAEPPAQEDGRLMKLPNIMTNLKQTYMEKLDFLGGHRSPSARH